MNPRKVLCIDNEDTCQLYDSLFAALNENLDLTCAPGLEEAMKRMEIEKFDLFILEPYGRGFNGIELCRFIREKNARTPLIIYTGMGREIDRAEAMESGASAYFLKPGDLDEFIKTVKEFLK